MNQIVIDGSVAIKRFVVEPFSEQAHWVLEDYRSGDLTLLAPDLIYAEIGNIMWKKRMMQGLSATDAQAIISAFRTLTLVSTSSADLLDAAYRLAVKCQRTVYDSLYLALCVREGCPFVTADEKLVNAVIDQLSNVV